MGYFGSYADFTLQCLIGVIILGVTLDSRPMKVSDMTFNKMLFSCYYEKKKPVSR